MYFFRYQVVYYYFLYYRLWYILYSNVYSKINDGKMFIPKSSSSLHHNGPSESGRSFFLPNLFLNFINELDKIYIYSPSLLQDFYQKLIKCFSNFIPNHIIPNVLNEKDIDVVIDEVINKKDFEKSKIEKETYDSIEELKFPQVYNSDQPIVNNLDDLNEKQMDDPRVQAMFKRSKLNDISIFIISQDYYKLSKKTIRANGSIYHIFKPNHFLDVQKIYLDKASMDMTLGEFKYLTSTCLKEKYQSLPIDMSKDKYTG